MGTLMESVDDGVSWRMLPSGTTDRFRGIGFEENSAEKGIAVMDSTNGAGVLRYTYDGGQNWLPIGIPEYDLNGLYRLGNQFIAFGNNGTLLRVYLNADTVGVAPVPFSAPDADFTAVWGMPDGTQTRIMAGTGDGRIFGAPNLNNAPAWTEVVLFPATERITSIAAHAAAGQIFAVVLTNANERIDLEWTFGASPVPSPVVPGTFVAAATDGSGKAAVYDRSTDHDIQLVELAAGFTTTIVAAQGDTPPDYPLAMIMLNDGHLITFGNDGSINSAIALDWVSHAEAIRPHPLHAIDPSGTLAVGDQGCLFQRSGSSWKIIPTEISQSLRAVSGSGTLMVAVGEAASIVAFDPADATNSETITAPITSDLLSVALSNTELHIGSTQGTVLHCVDVTAPAPAFVVMPANIGHVNAMVHKPSSTELSIMCQNGIVQRASGTTRFPVDNVFVPRLNGISLTNGSDGYVVGDHLVARYTPDAGAHWYTVPHPQPQSLPMPALNAVQSLEAGEAMAVGNSARVVQLEETQWTAISGIAVPGDDLLALSIAPSGAGIIAGGNGSNGIYYRRDQAPATTWTSTSTSQPMRAIWNFPRLGNKDEFLLGGDLYTEVQLISLENGNVNSAYVALPAPATVHAFWFHDHVSGFALCENGNMYRTSVSTDIDHSIFDWDPLNVFLHQTVNGQDNYAAIQPVTIGFSDRHNGFIGGSYNGSPAGYARTVVDESGLYSQRFWYDLLGRLVLSQNTRQYEMSPQRFSYTFYDNLGRVYEAGEVEDAPSTDPADSFAQQVPGALVSDQYKPNVVDADVLQSWVSGQDRYEVTRTYYDEGGPDYPYNPNDPRLRLRVATTVYDEDPQSPGHDHATHYSYDIHGNVRSMVQEHPHMAADAGSNDHARKKIDYTYDLVSGNVRSVAYQAGAKDAMHHRYEYDADNRIVKVQTSQDNALWYTDAEYFYYPHGPLQRTEIGEHKVQGVDYAYTLQGWLKGINSDRLVPETDMGADGVNDPANPNQMIGRDAFGFSLSYFGDDDYEAIDPVRWNNATGTRPFTPIGTTGSRAGELRPLFNGNIASSVYSLQPLQPQPFWSTNALVAFTMAHTYTYDQLNRLVDTRAIQGLPTANTWEGLTDGNANRYRSKYTYDANGNIKSTWRWDRSGNQYDKLTYHYHNDAGLLLSNRLYHLHENNTNNPYSDIQHDLTPFNNTTADINSLNNYRYDQLGNLIQDRREEIDAIEWTVSGKVKRVARTSGSALKPLTFGYGTGGQRISKTVDDPINPGGSRQHYVHDAQGNIMATYTYKASGTASLRMGDRPIYGSSRVGVYDEPVELLGSPLATTDPQPMYAPRKRYELTDHLGNVNAVVTGQLVDGQGAGSQKQAVLVNAQRYEPFGAPLPQAGFAAANYRFAFNGMEKDDEVHNSTGNSYDFGARLYDPRVGRWWSVDPLAGNYAAISPYTFAINRPTQVIDPDGERVTISIWTRVFQPKIAKAYDVLLRTKEVQQKLSPYMTERQARKYGATKSGVDLSGKVDIVLKASSSQEAGNAFTKFSISTASGSTLHPIDLNDGNNAQMVNSSSQTKAVIEIGIGSDPELDFSGTLGGHIQRGAHELGVHLIPVMEFLKNNLYDGDPANLKQAADEAERSSDPNTSITGPAVDLEQRLGNSSESYKAISGEVKNGLSGKDLDDFNKAERNDQDLKQP